MSDTPETDAQVGVGHMSIFVSAEFARKLERQRDALLEALQGLLDFADEHTSGGEAIEIARKAIEECK